ncbi:MAG TPA: efflux RND transporter periplasmic adaptor subunit [Tepidisphaeraceae bacterium]|nr:efflux RND transporter periplasmic adaptor subunit [Tepidisphaeraceae bacterium]
MKQRRASSATRVIVWVVAVVVVVAIGVALYLRFARPMVTVTEVARGPVVQAFYATGTISPAREYPIKSNVAGILEDVKVDKGVRVTAGQVVAVVAAPDLEYALRKAQAELDEKVKRADPAASPVLRELDARIAVTGELLAISSREKERVAQASESRVASQSDVDRALDRFKTIGMEFEAAKTQRAAKELELAREVEVARAAVDTATYNLNQRNLTSPIDGVVLDRPQSKGTRLAVNDHVLRIADVDPSNLVMRAQVDEEDKTVVRVGQPVRMTLYSYADRVFDGVVEQVYPQADPQRRTFEVDVRLTEPDPKLSAGMTGELAFIQDQKTEADVVPSQAVQNGAVYVVRDGRLHKADAKLGLRSVERVEVEAGLRPGDRVVISAVGSMADGQSVRTTFIDPAEAAGLNKPKVSTETFKGFN